MNGKIKTKFAALFAVALMITVCVVPVVGNEGTDAAPVSSSNGEVFEGYELKLFTEGMDNYDDLVYYGSEKVNGISSEDYAYIEIDSIKKYGYLVNKDTGLFLRYADIPNYTVWFDLPIVQFTYVYSEAAVNNVEGKIIVKQGTTEVGKFDFEQKLNSIEDKYLKNEGIVTFGLYNGIGTDHLEIAEAMAAGNFDVEITATQGVTQQVIKQTINAGPAVTVSGQITDADGNGIKGTITPVVEGNTLTSLTVKEDGKYSFNVIPGSVVSITADASGYSFKTNEDTWYFGDVNASVTKNFKAVEKTGTIYVLSANGIPVDKENVTLAWYTQVTKTVTDTTTNTSTTSYDIAAMGNSAPAVVSIKDYSKGTVSPLTGAPTYTTDKDGKVSFAYKAPAGTVEKYNNPTASGNSQTTYSDYSYALVVLGDNNGAYSFETESFNVGGNSSSIQTIIGSKSGMADAQGGSATITSKESTGTIIVQSANGNPVAGVTVNLAWYTQVTKTVTDTTTNTSTTSYDIAAMGNSAPAVVSIKDYSKGTVSPLTGAPTYTTDKDGKVSFAYKAPAGTVEKYNNPTASGNSQTTYSDYSYALVVSGTSGDYKFNVQAVTGSQTSSIQTIIGSKSGMADAQGGSATIKANENSFKITGTIEGYAAKEMNDDIVSYKLDGASAYVSVNLQKDGTFEFYVIEGKVLSDLKITSVSGTVDDPKVFDADLYVNKNISIGTVYQNVTVDFKLKNQPAPTDDVSYEVVISDDVIVTFDYSVDGVKYSADIKSENKVAKLTLKAKIGSVIEVSATAEGYDIPAFDGYKTFAVHMTTMYVQIQAEGEPVPGATFKVLYTYDEENLSMDLTADENGFANFTVPTVVSQNVKIAKGTYSVSLSSASEKTDYDNGITYSVVTLNVYKAEASKVAIMYASAYNSDSVLAGPVDMKEIAPGKTVTADVGDSIALKAPKIDNFEFVAWMVDGVVVSEKADYTLVVPAHDHDSNEPCEAVALYSAVHYEESAEGLSMNVLVIGIVILILGILAVAYGIISKKQ